MKHCLLPFLILLTFSAHAQVWRWATGSDAPGGTIESWPMAIDSAGNIYEAGSTSAAFIAYFGTDTVSSLSAFVVVSLDTGGNYRWARGASSAFGAVCNMVTDASGNLFLFGWYQASLTMGGITVNAPTASSATAFCARLTDSGSVVWIRNIADSVSTACFGGIDGEGNFYVTGSYVAHNLTMGAFSLPNHSSSRTDIYVARLDTAFNVLWAHSFGGKLNEVPKCAVVTPAGDFYSGGLYFSDTMYIGTDTLTGPALGSWYFYLAKYNAGGALVWNKIARTRGNDNFGNFSLDSAENIFFTGGYTQTIVIDNDSTPSTGYGVFLSKISSAGTQQWLKQVNVPSLIQAWCVVPDAFHNLWLSGAYHSNSTLTDSMYVLQLDDTAGAKNLLLLASGGDDASTLLVDNKGGLYVGGDYEVDSFVIGSDTLRLKDASQEVLFAAKYCYMNCFDTTTDTATAVRAVTAPGVDIYPNPTDKSITITAMKNIADVMITDLSGRLVMQAPGNGTNMELNISSLCSGMYLVRITGEDRSVAIKKVIKE